MCGIVGYIGNKRCINVLMDSLASLEYRGYDSSGIALVEDDKIKIFKEEGRLENLKNELDLKSLSNVGIGHTRWATHGRATKNNAHPHQVGYITLVHNGIIENYLEIKNNLKFKDYKSETDTEVACALINEIYCENHDMLKTLEKVKSIIKGSYAFVILVNDIKETIFVMRKDSPLIVGVKNEESFIASDMAAIVNYTTSYCLLDDGDIGIIKKNDIKFYNNGKLVKKEFLNYEGSNSDSDKGKYDHFMLKEIYEEKDILNALYKKYINKLEDFDFITNYDSIEIVGCGSSFNVGNIAKSLFQKYGNIIVNVYLASEYRYEKNYHIGRTLVIFISQSGETADTLASLRKIAKDDIDTLAIVNTISSSLAREADKVIYTECGIEVSVATTKALSSQLMILTLMLFRRINKKKSDLADIKNILSKVLDNQDMIKEVSKKLVNAKNIYYLGRGIDYSLSMEAALKLKEISYINAESYASGELKHGTISLIEEGTPVISIVSNSDISLKIISNIKETKARGSYSVVITPLDLNLNGISDFTIKLDKYDEFTENFVIIMTVQLLSYYVAAYKGCDIDKPRNLAKSVTVE